MPVETITQQKAVLSILMKRPHNTIELRSFDILCPNPRILELRQMGFYIITMWEHIKDKQGEIHKIGKYFYLPSKDQLTPKGEEFYESLYQN